MKIITEVSDYPNFTPEEIVKMDIALGGDALIKFANNHLCEISELEHDLNESESSLQKIKIEAHDLSIKLRIIADDLGELA